jgi:Cu/Zn superoxide dismutase
MTIHSRTHKLALLTFTLLVASSSVVIKADGGGSYGPYSRTPLFDAKGKDAGTVLLYGGAGLHAVAVLRRLPAGEYRIMLHAGKACTAPDFKSAGDLLILAKKPKKPADNVEWNAGAYPVRITVHVNGKGRKEADIPYAQLWGNRNVAGHTIILSNSAHLGEENRLACGVIAPAS